MWLESDKDRVRCLMSEVFGIPLEKSEPRILEMGNCPMSRVDLTELVRRALEGTKNGSALG